MMASEKDAYIFFFQKIVKGSTIFFFCAHTTTTQKMGNQASCVTTVLERSYTPGEDGMTQEKLQMTTVAPIQTVGKLKEYVRGIAPPGAIRIYGEGSEDEVTDLEAPVKGIMEFEVTPSKEDLERMISFCPIIYGQLTHMGMIIEHVGWEIERRIPSTYDKKFCSSGEHRISGFHYIVTMTRRNHSTWVKRGEEFPQRIKLSTIDKTFSHGTVRLVYLSPFGHDLS